jgi:RHS repeat-associated protein
VAELTGSTVSATYVRGINLIAKGGGTQYHSFNAHGDVVQLTNSSGTVTKDYRYDAFGVEVDPQGTDTNPWRYCGEYWDRETGTVYLRARYYDPATSRMLTEDSVQFIAHKMPNGQELVDPLSLNLYTYAHNNPVYYQDPGGHFVITTTVLVCIGLAALVGTVGGLVGNHIANQKGATGWEKAAWIGGGVVVGGAVGATGGYFAGPAIAAATGVGGLSVTSAGIATVASTSPWVLDQFTRGQVIEKILGGWGNNFPVIDKVGKLVNGVHQSVTSIKSIDLAAKSYQSGNTLYNTIMGYTNSLANFTTKTYGGFTAYVGSGTQRVLEVAIPSGATSAQMAQINKAVADAAKLGVDIVTKVIK